MRTSDHVIEKIAKSSLLPAGKRGREILRELRSHVEDFELEAREAGQQDDEVAALIAARFGDPEQIAHQFSWVYRRERAFTRLAVFVLSTLIVALVITI